MYVETTESLLGEQGSLSVNHTNSVVKYSTLTSKKGAWLVERNTQKNYAKPNSAYTFNQGVATSTLVFTDGKITQTNQANIIANKNNLYLRLLSYGDHKAIGKWIEVPHTVYKEFGMKAGIIDALEAAIQDSSSAKDRAAKKVLAAYKKHRFYVPAVIADDGTVSVPNSTRYDYLVNDAALAAYYKELSQTLTNEERLYTMLGIEGFETAIKDKKYRTIVTEYSSASIWIDKTTLKPVLLFERTLFKDPVKKKEVYQVTQNTTFGKAKSVSTPVPKKFLNVKDGAELLNFKLWPSLEESYTYQDTLIMELGAAKSKEDKNILANTIAYGYQAIGSREKAAKYYTLASTYADSELERLVYLAKAELALGKGKQAMEYFEKAYKIDPDDYFVQFEFGDFLNGNTTASAPYKNVSRALELNEGWEDELRDDGNLLSLYVNYILLKQFNDAKKLEEKFEIFEDSRNYMAIARAYHQIGDVKMSKKYQDLAAAEGYVWLPGDHTFFASKFKNGKMLTK
jgi:tetratricopeptide (TPR) repeat protein